MRFRPLLLLCLLTAPLLRAQDAALKATFTQAKALWATQGDRVDATARFEQVLAALAPKAATLDPAWTNILCQTYNWLAVLDDRNPATKARAITRLQALIDLNPDFDVDRTLTSQRLTGIFDRLKAAKLAQVKLTCVPDGGQLQVDGKPTSLLARKFLPFGTHALTYSHPGYASATVSVDLGPQDVKPVSFTLTRTSSTVTIYVQPSGAEVLLDGHSLGHTRGQAGPEALAIAVPMGLRPEDLSAGFVLDGLKPGKHDLEVRAPCYRPKRLAMDPSFATPFADHVLEPIRLEPSRATLTVTSAWPGGELFLSGEDRGPLPAKALQVCAGAYELQVRFPSGGYTQSITLAEGGALALEVKPQPRLAFLGMEGSQDFPGRDRIQGLLAGLGPRLKHLAFQTARPGESPQVALTRLKADHDAELFLLATPVPGPAIHEVELQLSTPEGETERLIVKPLEDDPLAKLVARLNAQPTLTEPSLGATLLDLPGMPGPWVLSASEAAQKAGLKLHEPILRVDGQPVADRAALHHLLEATGHESVRVLQAGAQPVDLPIIREPLELPLASPRFAYPAVLARLRLQYVGAKGDKANLLKLEIGLALMHFRDYDRAIEELRDAHLGTAPGVGQGTLDYETGRCFMGLGLAYRTEAIQAFREALKYPQATLFGPDGPRVAPLAQQSLEDLK